VAIRRAEERPDEPSAASVGSAAAGDVDDRRTIFLDARSGASRSLRFLGTTVGLERRRFNLPGME
jgi:hypothetical protein